MPLETGLDRGKLHKLADRYEKDAKTLLKHRGWASAYYLAGYAVECALKACIAKQFRKYAFPHLKTVQKSYTHDLKELLGLAGLGGQIELRCRQSDQFKDHWERVVMKWRETSRYEQPTRALAQEMIQAVSDTKEGVLPWIRLHW